MIADTIFNINTALVQKPVLRFMAHQPTLRKLFSFNAMLTYRPFKNCKIEQVDLDGVRCLKITPQHITSDTRLLYFHGGGFTIGSPETHKWMVARLAHYAGLVTYVADYRLAPERPFPAAHDDAQTCFDALAQHGPVAIGGDSAGGQLSLALVATGRRPKVMILLSPLATVRHPDQDHDLDFSQDRLIPRAWVNRVMKKMFPNGIPIDPRLQPLENLPDDLPPTLLHVVREEGLALDAKATLAAIPNADIEWFTGVPHVWQLHAGWSATSNASLRSLGQFLKDNA